MAFLWNWQQISTRNHFNLSSSTKLQDIVQEHILDRDGIFYIWNTKLKDNTKGDSKAEK